jgi:hypothetical protein
VTYIPFAPASDGLQLLKPFRVLLKTSELLPLELEFLASDGQLVTFRAS